MSNLKGFINKQPIHRKKIRYGITLIGMIIISTIFCYTYIINSPAFINDIPRINITYEDKPDFVDFVDCTFEMISENSEDNIEPLKAKLKLKGNPASWRDKKSYRLEFPKQISILGMRKDDDWSLLGMFSDYTRMRTKLATDLWRNLEPENPTAILPDMKYVCLYINNEFEGLYLIAERTDRRLFDLDDSIKSIYSSLIFQAKYRTNFREYINDRWEQDWPNEDEDIYIMDEILIDLFEFINNSNDEDFYDPNTGIYTIFDKLNLIDFYLYNFFILHGDFWYKNYFLIRNTYPNKFYLIPWDFDSSLGQHGWLLYDSDINPDNNIKKNHALFNRLLANERFIQDCKNRWNQLREEIWTDSLITEMLSDIYEEIKDVLEFEMELWEPETVEDEPEDDWPDIVIYSTKDFDLDEYIKELFRWIPERLVFCDTYFS